MVASVYLGEIALRICGCTPNTIQIHTDCIVWLHCSVKVFPRWQVQTMWKLSQDWKMRKPGCRSYMPVRDPHTLTERVIRIEKPTIPALHSWAPICFHILISCVCSFSHKAAKIESKRAVISGSADKHVGRVNCIHANLHEGPMGFTSVGEDTYALVFDASGKEIDKKSYGVNLTFVKVFVSAHWSQFTPFRIAASPLLSYYFNILIGSAYYRKKAAYVWLEVEMGQFTSGWKGKITRWQGCGTHWSMTCVPHVHHTTPLTYVPPIPRCLSI